MVRSTSITRRPHRSDGAPFGQRNPHRFTRGYFILAAVVLTARSAFSAGERACLLQNIEFAGNISAPLLLANLTAIPSFTSGDNPKLACTSLSLRNISAFTVQDGTFDGFSALSSLSFADANFSARSFPPLAFAGLPQLQLLSFQRIFTPVGFGLPSSWAEALAAPAAAGNVSGMRASAATPASNLTSFAIAGWANLTRLAQSSFADLPRLTNVTLTGTGLQFIPARLFQTIFDLAAAANASATAAAGVNSGSAAPLPLRIDIRGNAGLATEQGGCGNVSDAIAALNLDPRPAIFLMPLLQSNGSAAGVPSGGSGSGSGSTDGVFANVSIAGPPVACTLVDNVNECAVPDGVAPGTVNTPTLSGTDPWIPATGDAACNAATSVCRDVYVPWYIPRDPAFSRDGGRGLCYNCISACAFSNWVSAVPLSSADTARAHVCSAVTGSNMTIAAAWRNVSGVGWLLTCFDADALTTSMENATSMNFAVTCVMGPETAAPGELPPWLAPPYQVPVPPDVAGGPGVTGSLAAMLPGALSGLVQLKYFQLQIVFASPPSAGLNPPIAIAPEWRTDWGAEALPQLEQLIVRVGAGQLGRSRAAASLPPSALAQLAFSGTLRPPGSDLRLVMANAVPEPLLLPAGLLLPSTYDAFAAQSAAAGLPPGPSTPGRVDPKFVVGMDGYNESLAACDATMARLYSGSYSYSSTFSSSTNTGAAVGAATAVVAADAEPMLSFNSSLSGYLPDEIRAASPRLDRALLLDAATLRSMCPKATAATVLCFAGGGDPTAPALRVCTLFPNLNQCPPRALRNGTWSLTPDVRRSAWIGAAAASPRDYLLQRGAPALAQPLQAASFAALQSGVVGAALLRLDGGAGAASAAAFAPSNSTSALPVPFAGAAMLWGGRPVAGCAGSAVPAGLRQPAAGSPGNGSGSVGFQDTPVFYDAAAQSWYAAPGAFGRAAARVGAAAAFVPSLSAVIVLGGVDARAACGVAGAAAAPTAPLSDAVVLTIRSSPYTRTGMNASGSAGGAASSTSSSSVFASAPVDTVFTSAVPVAVSLPDLLNSHARIGATAVFVPIAAVPSVQADAGSDELTYGAGMAASDTGSILLYGGTRAAAAALPGATVTVQTGTPGLFGFRPIDPLVDGSGIVTAVLGAAPPYLALGNVLAIDAAQMRSSLVLPCELSKGIEPSLQPPSAATGDAPWVPHPRAFHVALFVPALGESIHGWSCNSTELLLRYTRPLRPVRLVPSLRYPYPYRPLTHSPFPVPLLLLRCRRDVRARRRGVGERHRRAAALVSAAVGPSHLRRCSSTERLRRPRHADLRPAARRQRPTGFVVVAAGRVVVCRLGWHVHDWHIFSAAVAARCSAGQHWAASAAFRRRRLCRCFRWSRHPCK